MSKVQREHITLEIETALKERLKEIASQRERTVSAMVRHLIKEFIDQVDSNS